MVTRTSKQRIAVPARAGRAVRLHSGARVRIVDVAGGQVGDVFAFAAPPTSGSEFTEYLSAAHTRAQTQRLFPAVGDDLVTNRRRPILTLVSDDSPGRHDMLIAACDAERYAALGAAQHPSCAQNLFDALAGVGLVCEVVPQPVNVFMNVPVSAGGLLSWRPAATAPGDSITFETRTDCVVVVSACPQDLTEINGSEPTELALDLSN
jgi:uncharacterized protein YcgI (DUF1989 family)